MINVNIHLCFTRWLCVLGGVILVFFHPMDWNRTFEFSYHVQDGCDIISVCRELSTIRLFRAVLMHTLLITELLPVCPPILLWCRSSQCLSIACSSNNDAVNLSSSLQVELCSGWCCFQHERWSNCCILVDVKVLLNVLATAKVLLNACKTSRRACFFCASLVL